jgi:adenylylsulfate kinase
MKREGEPMRPTQGAILWFTGLSGAGKTTTAQHVYDQLTATGQHAELLDGDEIRRMICKGLGFSREDRLENIRRIAYVAGLLSRHGVHVLVSAITPYREMREYLRGILPNYVEIYVKCSLQECEKRDVKGLYAKARRNEITAFTGISDPYEEPQQADLVINSQYASLQENSKIIIKKLEALYPHTAAPGYAEVSDC